MKNLPTAKRRFALTYWKKEESIITLGGWANAYLKEVQQYCRLKNEWKELPFLPISTAGSSTTVFTNVLFNFGGFLSSNSVYWLDLMEKRRAWKSIKTLGAHADFCNYHSREATVEPNCVFRIKQ